MKEGRLMRVAAGIELDGGIWKWGISIVLIFLFIIPFCRITDTNSAFNNSTVEDRTKNAAKLFEFTLPIYQAVREKQARHELYFPDEYFSDLRRIYEKEDELHMPREWNREHLEFLTRVSHDQLKDGKFTRQQWIEARDRHRINGIGELAEKPVPKVDPEKYRIFFRNFYWRGMLLALLFFLVCLAEDITKREGSRLLNPIFFLLCLILYPIVFGYRSARWMRDQGRRTAAEVAVRRRRIIHPFSELTIEDLQKIDRLVKNGRMSFSHWRQEVFADSMKPRHGLAVATAATLIFMLLPRESCATKTFSEMDNNLTIESSTGHHLPRSDIADEKGGGQTFQTFWPSEVLDFNGCREEIFIPCSRYVTRKTLFCFQEVVRNIIHIPILTA